jgi:hypothetical protein
VHGHDGDDGGDDHRRKGQMSEAGLVSVFISHDEEDEGIRSQQQQQAGSQSAECSG